MEKGLDFLEDINTMYNQLEYELNDKLNKIKSEEQRLEKANNVVLDKEGRTTTTEAELKLNICTNLESAKKRNNELIKSLEITKARLRSRATYSPLEILLEKSIQNYIKELTMEH